MVKTKALMTITNDSKGTKIFRKYFSAVKMPILLMVDNIMILIINQNDISKKKFLKKKSK